MSTLRYLSSTVSQEIDLRLMSVEFGFGLEQLMELAGLSCAQAIHHVYSKQKFNKPLICCGTFHFFYTLFFYILFPKK